MLTHNSPLLSRTERSKRCRIPLLVHGLSLGDQFHVDDATHIKKRRPPPSFSTLTVWLFSVLATEGSSIGSSDVWFRDLYLVTRDHPSKQVQIRLESLNDVLAHLLALVLRWSSLSSLGTILAQIFCMPRSSVMIFHTAL